MTNSTEPSIVKKKQQRNFVILAVTVALLLWGLAYLMGDKKEQSHVNEKSETVEFATSLNHVDPQSVWVERAQNQLAQQTKTSSALEQQMQLLQQAKDNQDKQTQQTGQTLQALQTKVDLLTQQLTQQRSSTTATSRNDFPAAAPNSNNPAQTGESFIKDDALTLSPLQNASYVKKNSKTYLPTGTHVRAVVLGGADASTGVTSQGDPEPMLIRFLDNGTLPNHKHSQLKDCVATAAVVGDISSERGKIRLERLSCAKDNKGILDIPVEATVFGPDGKNGLRGTPLWREGALVQRAFIAGTLSGFSNSLAQSFTRSSTNPWGSTQTVDPHKIFQYGLANGAGNAADKLAEYNIKRAEQYHPVVQLSAGVEIDVVFLKGFYWDGKKHDDNEADSHGSPPNANNNGAWINASNESTDNSALPLTDQQIKALKQKNIEQGYR
ncbi:TraB/VirB10 family protein [soil metagenome]